MTKRTSLANNARMLLDRIYDGWKAHQNVQRQGDGGTSDIKRQPLLRTRLCYAIEDHETHHLLCSKTSLLPDLHNWRNYHPRPQAHT
jgi:hypothetical protein